MTTYAESPGGTHTPQALTAAVVLHVLVVAGVVAYFWGRHAPLDPVGSHFVITVVPGPPASTPSVAPGPRTNNPPNQIKFDVPKLNQFKPLPPAPAPSVPAPQQLPPKPPSPPVKATTVAPTPVASATHAAPTAPATKAMSYRDFVSQSGPPKNSSASARASGPARNIPAVSVDPSAFTSALQQLANGGGTPGTAPGGGASPGQTSAWMAAVQRMVQNAYQTPGGLDVAGLSAQVEITVSPNGFVLLRRMVTSSGNPTFDAAVMAALQQVSNVGPTPDGQTWPVQFLFRPGGA